MNDAKQRAWIRSATPEDLTVFLSRGAAGASAHYFSSEGKTLFRPSVRGMRLKSDPFDTEAQAVSFAEETLADMKEQAKAIEQTRIINGQPLLDENALGISGQNAAVANFCEGHALAFDHLLHLGSMIGAGREPDHSHPVIEVLLESILDMASSSAIKDKDAAGLTDSLPFLADLVKALSDMEMDNSELLEMFQQACVDYGHLGFLALVTTPVRDYATPDASSSSFSWSHYRSDVVYGDTMEEIMGRAESWAEAMNALDREASRRISAQSTAETEPQAFQPQA